MDGVRRFRVETIEAREQVPVLAVSGELSLHTVCTFRAAVLRLIDAGARQIVVDLTAVTFIDSTALGVLMSGQRQLQPRGGAIVVAACEPIALVFKTVGLERLFAVCATRAEGLCVATARQASCEGPL